GRRQMADAGRRGAHDGRAGGAGRGAARGQRGVEAAIPFAARPQGAGRVFARGTALSLAEPRASRPLMILSAPEARGPGDHERHWSGALPAVTRPIVSASPGPPRSG